MTQNYMSNGGQRVRGVAPRLTVSTITAVWEDLGRSVFVDQSRGLHMF